ncbi:hypothetical protein [Nonomuraea sp. NPDC049607]|uniref:hypothetical protein n=1 Tax=unclassified Nonomuraea TaxID=2593643 RepID=UPI00341A0076
MTNPSSATGTSSPNAGQAGTPRRWSGCTSLDAPAVQATLIPRPGHCCVELGVPEGPGGEEAGEPACAKDGGASPEF